MAAEEEAALRVLELPALVPQRSAQQNLNCGYRHRRTTSQLRRFCVCWSDGFQSRRCRRGGRWWRWSGRSRRQCGLRRCRMASGGRRCHCGLTSAEGTLDEEAVEVDVRPLAEQGVVAATCGRQGAELDGLFGCGDRTLRRMGSHNSSPAAIPRAIARACGRRCRCEALAIGLIAKRPTTRRSCSLIRSHGGLLMIGVEAGIVAGHDVGELDLPMEDAFATGDLVGAITDVAVGARRRGQAFVVFTVEEHGDRPA